MFERMKISENIYDGSVEPSYLKIEYMITVLITVGKREEYPPLQKVIPRWVNVLANASKDKKRYVYHSRDKSKLTCPIRGNGHSSEQCKFQK